MSLTGVELVLSAGAAVRTEAHRACPALPGEASSDLFRSVFFLLQRCGARLPLTVLVGPPFLPHSPAIHDQPLNQQGAEAAAEVGYCFRCYLYGLCQSSNGEFVCNRRKELLTMQNWTALVEFKSKYPITISEAHDHILKEQYNLHLMDTTKFQGKVKWAWD